MKLAPIVIDNLIAKTVTHEHVLEKQHTTAKKV